MWDRYAPLFQPEEFACRCGCGLNDMDPAFMHRLYLARKAADIPFVITSGCRCAGHNAMIGGAPTSDHLVGCGADIGCRSSHERFRIVDALIRNGIDRIGIARNFVHAGYNPGNSGRVVWMY